jgi:signal transduction histidine kinase
MGYDLLTKIVDLTDLPIDLKLRLCGVSKLLMKSFHVDSAYIYLWEGKRTGFRLAAKSGDISGLPEFYPPDSALPSAVMRRKKPIEIYSRTNTPSKINALKDPAFMGFRSIICYPLKETQNFFGILCMRSKRQIRLTERKRKLLSTISRQLASSVKSDKNLSKLEDAYSELKSLHTKLLVAERMSALAELSATLSHEIKNPIVSIGGLARRLIKKTPENSANYKYTQHIVAEAEKLEELTNAILGYSEGRPIAFKKLELNQIVNEALGLFSEACYRELIVVVCKKTRNSVPVFGDSQQLKIAFDNLISNAIQSMDKGGELSIITRQTKRWAIAEITDTGGGIEPSLIPSIFEPFFTTKKTGTGLGLSITHKLIEAHGGLIEVISKPGIGTCFRVKLPHGARSRQKK